MSTAPFRGARKKHLLVETTPGLCTLRQSLTLSPPRPMSTIDKQYVSDACFTLFRMCIDEAFSDCGNNTIFEVEYRLDGNLENQVRLVGVKTVFMKYTVDGTQER